MSGEVDLKIASLGDWRGDLLGRLRSIVLTADPEIVEEIKWRKPTNPLGVPTWSRGGIICTGESYKDKVKLTFMRGAALSDPQGLFKDKPTGTRRAIDFRRDDPVASDALAALVREAIRHNLGTATGAGAVSTPEPS